MNASIEELRVGFGNRLREQREARALTLAEIGQVTKIPQRALTCLEEGSFEELPADVFVRGFLRSYCRCVGLDADVTVRRYAEIAREDYRDEKPRSLMKVGTRAATAPEGVPVVSAQVQGLLPAAGGTSPGTSAPVPPVAARPAADEMTLMQAITEAGKGTSRMSLTLAVVILVIVATLTLSLLLRRPNHVGDGVSLRAPVAAPVAMIDPRIAA